MRQCRASVNRVVMSAAVAGAARSEEHTSELQSHRELVCPLLLEKKPTRQTNTLPYPTGPPPLTHLPLAEATPFHATSRTAGTIVRDSALPTSSHPGHTQPAQDLT